MLVEIKVLNESEADFETDSETIADSDLLTNAEGEVENDSRVETEVAKEPETDSETLADTD